MKNTFGNNVKVTLFGESHGECVGCVIDGFAPGIKIDEDYIKLQLWRRRPKNSLSTSRIETDEYRIVSGVYNGYTTGTPVCIIIPNTNINDKDYESLKNIMRPGHADYTQMIKYNGYQDFRGGGHFSGRLTSALVASGAIAELALMNKGILIGTHIKNLHGVMDRNIENIEEDIKKLNTCEFPVLDDVQKEKMKNEISKAKEMGESVGGITETYIYNLPAGLGEPTFDSCEGILSYALFGIPGIKGISFGLGFDFANTYGSKANDQFKVQDGSVITKTNNNGGINGGITNGMPIIINCSVKPTPSVYVKQETIDYEKMTNTQLSINGRHDPAIIHRVAPVIDGVCALCICDLLSMRYGDNYI